MDKHYYIDEAIGKIKKTFPFIPEFIIRRVLYANDLYLRDIGVIDFDPLPSEWGIGVKKYIDRDISGCRQEY